MKKDTAYEAFVQEMKNTQLPTIDVSEKVMGKMNESRNSKNSLLALYQPLKRPLKRDYKKGIPTSIKH